ncbi:MAG: serine/threonine-protein kinase [Polyangiales bacterium]
MAEPITQGACVDGRYVLQRPLGEGTFGGVWRARDSRLSDRLVAVKFLKPEFLEHPGTVARFEAEGEALARVSHANIVAVIDRGSWEGQRFLVTEFVDGQPLSGWIDQHRARSESPAVSDCLAIFDQIAAGMEAAHAVRAPGALVHRDLKPDNILIRSTLEGAVVKIVDFGIAQLGGRSGTRSGVMMGTPLYMAPEQAMGNTAAIGPWTDVFALGVILAEMLTLQAQVEEGEPWWGTALHRGGSVRALLGALGPEVPAEVWDVVSTCLKAQGAERFQHAGALRVALREAAATAPSQGPSSAQPYSLGAVAVAPVNVSWTPSRDSTLPSDPSDGAAPPPSTSAQAPAPRDSSQSLGDDAAPVPWLKLLLGVTLAAAGVAAILVTVVVRADHRRAQAILQAAQAAPPPRAPEAPSERAALAHPTLGPALTGWKRALESPRPGDDLSRFYAPRVRWHSSDRVGTPAEIARFALENAAAGGSLRVDLSRATVTDEDPAAASVAPTCRAVPGAFGPVWKVRAQVEERRADRIESIPCQTLRGVYLLRARQTPAGPRICHETWSVEEGICASCPTAAVCSRRR